MKRPRRYSGPDRAAQIERLKRNVLQGFGQRRLPFPRRQAVERPRADSDAHQPQGRMTNGGRHAADLPVAAFRERDLQPRGRHVAPKTYGRLARPEPVRLVDSPRSGRRRDAVLELHTAAQESERRGVRYALDLGEIGLLRPATRIGDPLLQRAVVGQEQQTLAVVVEPTCGIDVLRRHEIGECAPALSGGELAEHVEGLVEGDQHAV